MKLKLKRRYNGKGYTIGTLYVNDEWFCDTLEDIDRGLNNSMTLKEIKTKKVKGKTAIPKGVYIVDMNTVSPRFKARWWALQFGGIVPRLVKVKGFVGCLIHPGNSQYDTDGCILIGRNTVVGGLTESAKTYLALMQKLVDANSNGEEITIEIC